MKNFENFVILDQIERAVTFKRCGNFSASNDIYVFLNKFYPDNPIILKSWGKTLAVAGYFDFAIDLFMKASIIYNDGGVFEQVVQCNYHVDQLMYFKSTGYDKNDSYFKSYLMSIAGDYTNFQMPEYKRAQTQEELFFNNINDNIVVENLQENNVQFNSYSYEEVISDSTNNIDHQALEWFNKARNIDDYFKKIEYFSNAIEHDSKFKLAYWGRGGSYCFLKNYQQAILDFNKTIQIDPNFVSAYNSKGNAYFALRNYQEAINNYSNALEIDPKNAEAYYNRGNVHFVLKNFTQSISDFTYAIKHNPNYSDAYNNRGNAHSNLENYKQAITDYSVAIEINPDYAEAYSNRGIAYGNLNNNEEALTDFSKAIEVNPKYAKAYSNRGIAYENLNDYRASAADYNEYLRLAGNSFNDAEQVRQWIRDLGYEPKY